MPNSLPFKRGVLNQAGAGRTAGSTNYLDHLTGQSLDVFQVKVVKIGPHYALTEVSDNAALGWVRVDNALLNGSGPAHLGDTLIVGPLEFLPAGPRALSAWPTRAVVQHRPVSRPVPPRGGNLNPAPAYRQHPVSMPRRNRGTVTRVAQTGAFGQITDEHNGDQFFVHHSQLQRGAILSIGARVSFTSAKTPRGLSALEVQPA